MKKFLIIPVILILISVFLLVPISHISPVESPSGFQPDSSVVISGHVLPNGDLALFYYNSPSGINIIHSDTIIPVNNISLDLYSLKAENITISVAQFSGYYVHNVTTKIGNNTTITTPVKSMINPVYSNETIRTQYRQLESFSINLPTTSTEKNVSISIDNETFFMLHKTSPNIIPNYFSGLGLLGIALGYLFMGVVIFFLGTITADLLLKRMKYWPPFGRLGWFLILFLLFIAMGLIILADYYQIAYIQWYYWLIPFYIFSTLAMMELWPQNWEKWFVFVTGDGENTEWDAEFPMVSKAHGGYEYLRRGRKEAFKRIFHYIPVSFNISQPVEGIPLTKNDERISQFFIAKDEPFLEYEKPQKEEEGRKHRLRLPRRKRIISYKIPLTMHHTKPIAEFLGELRAVAHFATENEQLSDENLQMKLQIEKLGIKANRIMIDKIMEIMTSKKVSPKFVQKEEEENEKNEKKEKEERKDENRE